MTTIIVVVVVALVFFVTLCTVTFMVWKHEEEMRTDSLRSIESNLQELGYRLSDDFGRASVRLDAPVSGEPAYESRRRETVYSVDPFDWVNDQNEDEPIHQGACEMSDWETEAVDTEHDMFGVQDAVEQETLIYSGTQTDSSVVDDRDNQYETVRTGICGTEPENASDVVSQRPAEARTECELHETEEDGISLDDLFPEDIDLTEPADIDDIIDDDLAMLEDLEDIDEYVNDYAAEEMTEPESSVWYDIGQSGRKYTAEELDMLIKD